MMIKKQIENPNLIIPKNFETFILGKLFMEFLMSVYQYCTELNKAEKKQKILEAEVLLFSNFIGKRSYYGTTLVLRNRE